MPDPDAAAVYERVVAAHLDALEHVSGVDRAVGRRLPAALAAAGFSAVGSEGRASIWSGGGQRGRQATAEGTVEAAHALERVQVGGDDALVDGGRVRLGRGGRHDRHEVQLLRHQHAARLEPAAQAPERRGGIALCDDPRVQFVSPLVMAAWGHTA